MNRGRKRAEDREEKRERRGEEQREREEDRDATPSGVTSSVRPSVSSIHRTTVSTNNTLSLGDESCMSERNKEGERERVRERAVYGQVSVQ